MLHHHHYRSSGLLLQHNRLQEQQHACVHQHSSRRRAAATAAVCAQERAGAAAGSGAGQPQRSRHDHHHHPQPCSTTTTEAELSRSMQAAQSWPQLAQVLLQYSSNRPTAAAGLQQHRARGPQQQEAQALRAALGQLNSRHLARLLKALVRLQPHPSGKQEQQLFWSFSQLAFSECMQQLPSLSAWELSSTLWAASKLAQAPPPLLLRRLLQQLAEPDVIAAATAQDVSMSLYAVASLAVQVPEQQLELLLAAAALRMQDASPQALSNTLWAVATLQHRPSQQWLQQLEARCTSLLQASKPPQQQQPQQPQQPQQQQDDQWSPSGVSAFTSHGLYQLLWAMAKLQWQPTAAFTDVFWRASLAQLGHMTPHGTSGVLWAAASLSLQPPPAWAAAWLAALQAQMQQGRCRAQDYGNTLWAVVRLQRGLQPRPCEAWLAAALAGSEAVLPAAGTQELSNMLWSLAKLGVRPGGSWMHSWLAAMHARMGSYCAPALASSAYALAVLRFRPPRSWVQTLLLQTQRQMPAFGAQELSNLLWALAVLGVRPGSPWLKEFEVQALHEAGSFNAQELSIILWSMAKLQHTPPARWLARLLREGLEVAGGLQPQSLVLLLGSLSRWHLPVMHGGGHYRVLLPRYWAAAEQLLPQCSLPYLAALFAARVKLGVLPAKQWGASFWTAVSHQLAGVSAAQQQLPPATAAAAEGVSALQPAVVSQLLWSAGKLWRQARAPWHCLQLLLAAAGVVLPQCNTAGLVAAGIGLRHILQAHRLAARPQAQLQRRRPTSSSRRTGGSRLIARTVGSRQRGCLQSAARHRRRPATAAAASAAWAARYQQLQQLARPLWQAWFERGTQLLLAPSAHVSSCRELSLQLRVAASLRLQAPPAWLQAMQTAVQAQTANSSAEELSWLLLDLTKVHAGSAGSPQSALQLPAGFVQAVLCRAGVLHDSTGLKQQQMRRLQSAFRQLQQQGAVSEAEWRQWQRLLYVWMVSQGLPH